MTQARNTDCPYCEGHVYYDLSGNSESKCTECHRNPEAFAGMNAADVRAIVSKVLSEREDLARERGGA